MGSVEQKSLIYQGLFMREHAQDAADADWTSMTSNFEAPRKLPLSNEEDSIANPKTLLKRNNVSAMRTDA